MKTDVADSVETMLLMLLDGRHKQIENDDRDKQLLDSSYRKSRSACQNIDFDASKLCEFGDMMPDSVYLADMTESRLFTYDPAQLLAHPADILGDRCEGAMFHEQSVKWFAVRRLLSAPKNVAVIGKVAVWYEGHFRLIRSDGSGTYQKRYAAISRDGRALLVKRGPYILSDPAESTFMSTTLCSLVEDARRTNAMLASVKDAIEVHVPVPLDAYKEVFALREAPVTPGGRRKAIVHWVASHMRRSIHGAEHKVGRHTRGVDEFTIDGLRVRLSPNSV